MSKATAEARTTATRMDPAIYRVKLQDEALKPDYADCGHHFVREVAHWFGYEGFDDGGMREYTPADFFIIMERERNCVSDWMPLAYQQEAASHACRGGLVVAALKPEGRAGKVRIVAPAPCREFSEAQGPVCAVVAGRESGYTVPISEVFTEAEWDRLGLYLFVRSSRG